MNYRLLTRTAVMALPLVAGFGIAAFVFAAEGKHEGYTDTPMLPGGKWHVHDSGRPNPPIVTPAKTFSHLAPAPSDALVLFDGKDLSQWIGSDGKTAEWKIEDNYMEATKGVIQTKEKFGDFQLHLEFATPSKVEGNGQGRGNNGINIFGQYEIQVLDSYDNVTYADGQCSAIYGQYPPLVNASQKPGEWQTYDIMWEAPKWEGGKLVKQAYVTVLHNGLLVHHRQAVLGHTGHRSAPAYSEPHLEKGPIQLFYHGNAVRFRDIWIRPIETRASEKVEG